jgi:hypothetical protein
MSDRRAIVRSYQRLFRPDRRIYAIDGRTLPVPGGVPLRWLAYALGSVVLMLVLAGRSPAVAVASGGIAYTMSARLGRRPEGRRLAVVVAVGVTAAGFVVGVVDWPLRLIVAPAVVATALTQLSPDGRSVRRHVVGLARVRLAGRRRSGSALPSPGRPRRVAPRVAVAPDSHRASLVPSRITGPCRLVLAEPVVVVRGRRGRRHLVPVRTERRRVGPMVDRLRVAAGETVEVRP